MPAAIASVFLVLVSMVMGHGAYGNQVSPTKPLTAEVFPLGDGETKPLFKFRNETVLQADGSRIESGAFSDAATGESLLSERAEFAPGGVLRSYEVQQKQLQTIGRVEIKDGKARFSFKKDGNEKTSEESVGPDFVISLTLVPFLQKNWAAIKGGETLKVRFGVLDRRETIGFRLAKSFEGQRGGKDVVVVKMWPTSMFISAIVNPIYFTFTPGAERLIQFEGRTPILRKVDGSWKDFDGRTVYAP